jgi:hypothetical protein
VQRPPPSPHDGVNRIDITTVDYLSRRRHVYIRRIRYYSSARRITFDLRTRMSTD